MTDNRAPGGRPRVSPSWMAGRTVYHLHALGAAGVEAANPDVDAVGPRAHGLRVIRDWLDHVEGLGCGAVLLTPVFVATTHGYDTVDPFRIDQRLGDDHDFADLVDDCHRRDLKVILDGVFNHVGRAFPPFQDVVARRADSAFADWFRIDWSGDDGDGFGYRCFEGHRELVTLNHANPEVLDWATRVGGHWLDRGADGWRLDAAYAIPHEFVAAFVDRVRGEHPDAFLFGEVIHGDYSRYVADTGLDSITQYELHKAIWSALNDANLFELAWALKRHRDFSGTFAPVTFVGNHDVTRLASVLTDRRHLAAALAVLWAVPGHPCLYYGDELGWPGVKEHRAGGDDAIRPPLPATAEPGDDAQAEVLSWHRQLVGLRRDRPWLTNASLDGIEVESRRLSFTTSGAEHALHVVVDLTADELEPTVPWPTVFAAPHVVMAEQP